MIIEGIAVEITDHGFELDAQGIHLVLETFSQLYEVIDAIKSGT